MVYCGLFNNIRKKIKMLNLLLVKKEQQVKIEIKLII